MSLIVFQGTSVLQVSATDPDTGINAALTYSIEGITHTNSSVTNVMLNLTTSKNVSFPHILSPDTTVEGLFRIGAETGIISVSSEIDRENTGDVVTLTVKVPLSLTSVSYLFFLVLINLQSWRPQKTYFTAKNTNVGTYSCTHINAHVKTLRYIDHHKDQHKKDLLTS